MAGRGWWSAQCSHRDTCRGRAAAPAHRCRACATARRWPPRCLARTAPSRCGRAGVRARARAGTRYRSRSASAPRVPGCPTLGAPRSCPVRPRRPRPCRSRDRPHGATSPATRAGWRRASVFRRQAGRASPRRLPRASRGSRRPGLRHCATKVPRDHGRQGRGSAAARRRPSRRRARTGDARRSRRVSSHRQRPSDGAGR